MSDRRPDPIPIAGRFLPSDEQITEAASYQAWREATREGMARRVRRGIRTRHDRPRRIPASLMAIALKSTPEIVP